MAKEKSKTTQQMINVLKAPTSPSMIEDEKTLSTPAAAKGVPKPGRGKRVTIYLHEGDRRIIQELIAYLAGQGRRGLSESSTIKAALRTAKPGADLLRAHEEALAQDQRFK